MIKKRMYMSATRCGALVAAAALAASPALLAREANVQPASAGALPVQSAETVDPELISVLQMEAGRKVSEYEQSRGRLVAVPVSVTIDMDTAKLTADFGPGFRPGIEQEYAEMFLHSLATTLRYYAGLAGVKIHDVDYLFEGEPLKHYFPGDLTVPARARVDPENATALVSSSHGLVRVFPSADWDFQRPQFPITMEFTTANCSRPGACTPSKTIFVDPTVPVTVKMRCAGNLTGEARWSVVLRDADGVATAPAEFLHACFKPAA